MDLIKSNKRLTAVLVENVTMDAGFWAERQTTNRNRTIPAIHHQLEITGRLDAWAVDHKQERPKHHAVIRMFWDSDTGKWIEAASHSLRTYPDPELEKQLDELIARIQQAQQPDGYLNTYFTAVEPENRWRNLRDWHELYNAGHLIEGAVAHFQATGKRTLLDVLIRYIEHIAERFGPNPDQKHGYPGHPELELALVRLYRATQDERWLNLAKYFIDERGQMPLYFDAEAQERGEDPADFWAQTYHYCQAHEPVRDQDVATGHAVRACYLYAGVADVALETEDAELLEVSRRLWHDLTSHQMYITGGLGPARSNEGFTFAYDLPNETAYAETCASVALAFWAQRMFHLDPDGRYIDVMERALYNTVVCGVSIEGSDFFYANPLTSFPNVNPYEPWGSMTSGEDRYYRRQAWLTCPCCPPNLARMIASLGAYMYSANADTLYAHLYNTSQASLQLGGQTVQITQQTNYPWDGEIQFIIHTSAEASFDLALRIPGWCHEFALAVNENPITEQLARGYVHIARTWQDGDTVTLSLTMPVERMAAHPQIRMDAGLVALQRGPMVYCLEEVDNGPTLANVLLPHDGALQVTWDPELFGGVSVITGDALRIESANWDGDLYRPESAVQYAHSPLTFKAVPYCFWANRASGEMRVWLRQSE